MHKDRYRQIFCAQEFYSAHQNIFKMWKSRFSNLNNVEKVISWFVGLSCLRRPQDWYSGRRHGFFLNSTNEFRHSLNLKQLFQDTPIKIPLKLNPETNLIDLLNEVRIKAIPESCNRSLCYLANGSYPITVTEDIPAPIELLQMQIAGQRIISINENYEQWQTTLYSGRDHLGFIMHDLIHADHFFFKDEYRDAQLGFFRFAEHILQDQSLERLLQSESFKTGFEYIISDMNSHPVHLFQTLKTLLFSEIKNDFLSEKIWLSWVQNPRLSEIEVKSLTKLNTPTFSEVDAEHIKILCIRLGKQYSI